MLGKRFIGNVKTCFLLKMKKKKKKKSKLLSALVVTGALRFNTFNKYTNHNILLTLNIQIDRSGKTVANQGSVVQN